MKINGKELKKLLGRWRGAMKGGVGILKTVRLEGIDDVLHVECSTLEHSITMQLPGEGKLPAVCADYQALLAIPWETDADLIVDPDTGALVVLIGPTTHRLAREPIEAWTYKPTVTDTSQYLSIRGLSAALAYVAPAMARGAGYPHLQGVWLDGEGYAVATDGHRMHVARIHVGHSRTIERTDTYANHDGAFIPAALVHALAGLDTCVIDRDQGRLQLSGIDADSGVVMQWTVSTADFPPWRRVVPPSDRGIDTHTVELPYTTLIQAVRRLAPVKKLGDTVRVCIGHGALYIHRIRVVAGEDDVELARTSVPVETYQLPDERDPDDSPGLSSTYVIEALKAPSKKGIVTLRHDRRCDVVHFCVDGGAYQAVIAPMIR